MALTVIGKAEPTTFIYGLIDPTQNTLRYIGKSNKPKYRFNEHLKDTKAATHKTRWIRAMQKSGVPPQMIILEEVPKSEWQDAEVWWIAYFKGLGAKLTNATMGGDGNCDPSAETMAKWKAQTNSPERRAQISAHNKGLPGPNKGKTFSPEYRKKLSESHKGYKVPEDRVEAHRQWMVENAPMRGKTHTDEARAKIGASSKGRVQSEETKKKRADANRGKKRSAETKEKLAACQRGRKMSEEHMLKLVALSTGRVPSEETRAKLSAHMKVEWEKRRTAKELKNG